jgi:hypothetical protein
VAIVVSADSRWQRRLRRVLDCSGFTVRRAWDARMAQRVLQQQDLAAGAAWLACAAPGPAAGALNPALSRHAIAVIDLLLPGCWDVTRAAQRVGAGVLLISQGPS